MLEKVNSSSVAVVMDWVDKMAVVVVVVGVVACRESLPSCVEIADLVDLLVNLCAVTVEDGHSAEER